MPSYTTLSQLTTASSLADANLTLVTAGTTSQNATLLTLKNYVLAGTAATATKLATVRTINGVQFDGTANITIPFDISTGNAATATRLFTARTINGVSFDGTSNISIPITSLAFSNITALPTSISGYGITDAVSLTGTQTLTNKTLTAPNISTITNTGTLTLPTSADTLVGRVTTDTLLNKTISGSNNTISNIANASLTNSSITINGTTISLGGTATVGAVLANVLTIGDGISFTGASTYNGSTAVTIDLKPATDTQLGGIRVLAVGTSGIINGSGTLSLAVATTTQLGAVKVDGTSITATAPGGVITANAGGLSGTELNAAIVTSSLTGFGASPALTTPAVTTSITTPSTTFALVNTTATTVNFAGAATAIAIGAGTGTTTVNNNLTVTGNFTVNGSTEYLNSTTLQVLDKNIEMGTVASPTDVTADGGGITLKGATDKTITWSSVGWTSSEDFNLVTGKSYEINGAVVLSSTALGSVIVSSSLTSFGSSPALTTPAVTTSITTPSTTFALVNTTATTVNFAGEATALTIGATTAASVYNFATGATISGATKAINIGTSGVSGSTTAISIGSTVSGATSTTTIGGSTFTVSTPGIIDLGTSSTSTTTVTIGGVYDGNILKINGTGAAICGITTGATTGSFSIVNTGLTGELRLAGAATTFNIGHTTTAAQTVNMFTASTATSSYSIATGVTVNGATKSISIGNGGASGSTTSISIGTGGASGSITNITLGSGITSAGTTTVNNSLVASPVEASGTVTIGSLSGTGTITIGQSTQNQTINLANGITATGNTNTINIGSQGTASSTTTVTIGSLGTSSIIVNGSLLAQQATARIGYRSGSGAGGVQTQGTSRTTAVTLSKITGQITLFAAAGTSAWTTFTVNNTTVVLTDTVIVNVGSGTNTYIALVSAVANNSFNISFSAIVGTATDSPVFNFSVIKGVIT